jgi:hypothetical protein
MGRLSITLVYCAFDRKRKGRYVSASAGAGVSKSAGDFSAFRAVIDRPGAPRRGDAVEARRRPRVEDALACKADNTHRHAILYFGRPLLVRYFVLRFLRLRN